MIALSQKDGWVQVRDGWYTHASKTIQNNVYGCHDPRVKQKRKLTDDADVVGWMEGANPAQVTQLGETR